MNAWTEKLERVVRLGAVAVALTLAALLAIPSALSFLKSRQLVRSTEALTEQAARIAWADSRPVVENLEQLAPLLERLRKLDEYGSAGVLTHEGEAVHGRAMRVFVSNMEQGFVAACQQNLEAQLQEVTGDKYLQEYGALEA